VLLLFLSRSLVAALLDAMHRAMVGSDNYHRHPYYGYMLATGFFTFVVWLQKPRLFSLSRWRPTLPSFSIAVTAAILAQAIFMSFVADPRKFFAPQIFPYSDFIPVAVLAPVLEELFFRGAVLKSLAMRVSPPIAILLVSLAAAAEHRSFLTALPIQIMLSVVYVAFGDSLAASIACHIMLNAFPFLPLASFFQKWHVYTLWK
jgi:membrane protease YdiL (CAAX protease family)